MIELCLSLPQRVTVRASVIVVTAAVAVVVVVLNVENVVII